MDQSHTGTATSHFQQTRHCPARKNALAFRQESGRVLSLVNGLLIVLDTAEAVTGVAQQYMFPFWQGNSERSPTAECPSKAFSAKQQAGPFENVLRDR
jgi:hypothetical protein